MYVERFDSLSLLFYLYFLPERRLIKDILNRQTLNQFTSYAKQQYPDSAELQEHLVAQLQEQHFQQYMQQMSEHTNGTFEVNGERILGANNSTNLEQGNEGDRQPANVNGLREAFGNQLNLNGATDKVDGAGNGHTAGRDEGENEDDLFDEEGDEEEDDEDYDQNKAIANASMWTRQGIATFKNTIVNELNEGVLKIGHGEIATIKVPTHPDGNCLYWEFATDDYDIGFGLLFEWKESPDTQVSIHITESDDDEDDDDFLGNCLSFGIQAFQWKLIFILVHSPPHQKAMETRTTLKVAKWMVTIRVASLVHRAIRSVLSSPSIDATATRRCLRAATCTRTRVSTISSSTTRTRCGARRRSIIGFITPMSPSHKAHNEPS